MKLQTLTKSFFQRGMENIFLLNISRVYPIIQQINSSTTHSLICVWTKYTSSIHTEIQHMLLCKFISCKLLMYIIMAVLIKVLRPLLAWHIHCQLQHISQHLANIVKCPSSKHLAGMQTFCVQWVWTHTQVKKKRHDIVMAQRSPRGS